MKSFKIYIALGVLLLIVYAVAEYNRPVPTSWEYSYYRTDKSPFGTYLLYERLKDLFGKGSVETSRLSLYQKLEQLSAGRKRNQAYLLITDNFSPDKTDREALFRFISAGNQVFIAADYFNGLLLDSMKLQQSPPLRLQTEPNTFHFTDAPFTGKNFAFDKGRLNKCFTAIKNRNARVLGRNKLDSANFIMIRLGAGKLFLHTAPSAFTNYALVHPATRQYPAYALSCLPPDAHIVWDDYSAFGSTGERSPMRVVLNNENLRWAWFIATGTLLLFVLAEVKRRQRVIPVIKPPANRSLEFVNVIGQLYYEERNHTDLAHKKATYFGDFIRTHYELNPDDANFETRLAHKSGAAANTVAQVIHEISIVKKGAQISESGLISLNKSLEKFYNEVSSYGQ